MIVEEEKFKTRCQNMFGSWVVLNEGTTLYRGFRKDIYKIWTLTTVCSDGCTNLEENVLYYGDDWKRAEEAWDKALQE
jgi:hypothetical protein